MKIRLNKFIAASGICSRRKADEHIIAGKIAVNGRIVTKMGTTVSDEDIVTIEGKTVKPEKHVYILLNKPKDFITTTDDPGNRKTVMSLIEGSTDSRIYPVGRLDRNTTGLLMLTNDGDMARQLTHPSMNVSKIYAVSLDKPLPEDVLRKLSDGVTLEDGFVNIDSISFTDTDDHSKVGIELHSGKNRVVRRIFESVGFKVTALDRVLFAGLTKKDLPRRKWRILKENEIRHLKRLCNSKD